ncbi:MAG: DUF2911 domain-containing protein [Bacteroidota bacterium]|nr:DUF2911 domain-containing protein [Bacteroidota bacterium]
MKKILLAILALCTIQYSFSQIKVPAASPTETLIQDFGMGRLELTYSRPNLRGRSVFKENSELAPLGKVWRTGANASTKLKVTDQIDLAGNQLDSGSYAIFTIPGKKEWTIIINKDSKNWGTEYAQADDIFRFTVPAENMRESMETFTMQFTNIQPESCELHLMWGNVAVKIPIITHIVSRLNKQFDQALAGDNVNPNLYFSAANFYYDIAKDYNKALTNVTKATDMNPKAYYMFLLKAKIEKALGDKVSAKADAEKCVQLATEAKNDDYIRGANMLLKSL